MNTTLDLPEDLVREVHLRAAREGRALNEAVVDLLRKGLASTDADTIRAPGATAPRLQLRQVAFVKPARINLTFADKAFMLPIEKLDLPVDQFDWGTVAADPTGNAMKVKSANGDTVSIDASALRYLVDAQYATEIDQAIAALHMLPTEAAESARISMLMRDPRWNDVGDEDDLFEE